VDTLEGSRHANLEELRFNAAGGVRRVAFAFDPARRAKVDARAAELIAEEMTLRDLRRALERTQVHLARELGVKQETISRLEKRSDMLLSTLRSYVEAMGGELDLVARFPDRPPVRLKTLAALPAQNQPSAGRPRPTAARPRTRARKPADAAA
jgi:DNA-binding XRE family transcriptional regulator